MQKILKFPVSLFFGILGSLFFCVVCHSQNFTVLENVEAEGVANQEVTAAPEEAANQEAQAEPTSEAILASLPLGDLSTYTLGVEDVIEITVLRHPELSGQFVVNSEGKIQ